MAERIVMIVLDSFGVGALPDAAAYGDEGSNTYFNILKTHPQLQLKNMNQIGLNHIVGVRQSDTLPATIGAFGKAAERSAGKDTTTGHWEICGVVLEKPFPTFSNAFPKELIDRIEKEIGTSILGNEVASGTEIINRLGNEHLKTGYPIVYTSADSVLQIAAHEEVIPLQRLYEICEICRKLCTGPYGVGRIIARPFITENGVNVRTPNRRDFSLEPVGTTILDLISSAGMDVIGIGKIHDIFAGRGVTESIHTVDNADGIQQTIEQLKRKSRGLIFTNLVDFDMKYGHRNDSDGYARALAAFDERLPEIEASMGEEDVLMLMADHGCDPTTASTDHSREYIPILIYGKTIRENVDLGIRHSFSDIGATVLELLGLSGEIQGTSFAEAIQK